MASEQERFERWAAKGATGEAVEAVPAATVVLLRDGADGLETLMLRRDSKLAFAAGMWVFPGGRVDDEDREADDEDELVVARRAAAREAHEESGLVVAPGELVVLSHWMPPPQTPKRFSTWFFVASAPQGEVVIDDGEIRDHRWVQPQHALDARDAGEVELAPPTWVTLHRLAQHAVVADALADAARSEPEHFTTRAALTEEGVVTMWHGDAGYESGDPDAQGPRHRLWMVEGGWRYERTV
jgi:8-oxo-dGTP pyrophosphatase MutT (NUDIX family)